MAQYLFPQGSNRAEGPTVKPFKPSWKSLLLHKHTTMLKNYFKIAWRSLQKNRVFSFINVLGLAIGLTAFMLIAVYVYDELSYDKYPAKSKNMYRVMLSATGNGDVAVYPNVDFAVGEGMKNAFPEIKT